MIRYKSKFNELPEEIFSEIIPFLTYCHDVLSLLYVSKYINNIFRKSEYIESVNLMLI